MKTILFTILTSTLLMTSCKKNQVQPEPIEQSISESKPYHYFIKGYKNLVIHFTSDNDVVNNEIMINGSPIHYSDTTINGYYTATSIEMVHLNDTVTIINYGKSYTNNKVYITSSLFINEDGGSTLTTQYIVH